MLEAQIRVLTMWLEAGDRLWATAERARDDRDRGEVTSQTAFIVLLVIAAIAAAGIIAARITSNADSVPSP